MPRDLGGRDVGMTESGAFEIAMKNFLLGLSIGILLARILGPRGSGPTESNRHIVDIASKELLPASDSRG